MPGIQRPLWQYLAGVLLAVVAGLICVEASRARLRYQKFLAHHEGHVYRSPWLPPSAFEELIHDAVFRETERLFDDPNAYPIWIHCWHGRQRTAKALIIYDQMRGLTSHESLSTTKIGWREHPSPIVDFAYNYEVLCKARCIAQLVRRAPFVPECKVSPKRPLR